MRHESLIDVSIGREAGLAARDFPRPSDAETKMIMSPSETCPSQDLLKDYLSGLADDSQAETIETHLATCPSCEETLVLLEHEDDTMVRHLRAGSAASASSVDPALRSALNASRLLADESQSTATPVVARPGTPPGTVPPGTVPPGTVPPGTVPPGTGIGPYELGQLLGSGGMGAVYLAKHRDLGKQVAIKLLSVSPHQSDRRLERFMREIRAAGSLDHPAIVNATDAGNHDGFHYLAMEYIDGLDVGQIARAGQLSIADACEIVRQAALGLAYAHAQGVVHRDIKPSNLMLRHDGEVKILDFGLAQMSTWDGEWAELTTVGQLMGTLDYMSPEQAEQPGSVDYRADLYSLGATLFRLIGGRPPLAAAPNLSPLAKLRLLGNHRPPKLDTLRSEVDPPLNQLVDCLLASSPSDRPASAAHVAESLEPFCDGSDLASLVKDAQSSLPNAADPPTQTAEPSIRFSHSEPPKKRRYWLAAAMLPLLIVAAITIVLQTNKGQLIVESEVADVSVSLIKDGTKTDEIKIETGVNTTRLTAGSYQVKLDAGSDHLKIDKGTIVIRRGETTIARLIPKRDNANPGAGTFGNREGSGQPTPNEFISALRGSTGNRAEPISGRANAGSATIPSSDAPLVPGQRLRIVSNTSDEFEMELTVMADHTIKPRLVGVISVKGKTLSEVEQLLNESYRVWNDKQQMYRESPKVELFLDFDASQAQNAALPAVPPQSLRNLPSMNTRQSANRSQDESEKQSAKVAVYEGQSLDQWLEIVITEFEGKRLENALKAVASLATPRDFDRVLAAVRPNHDRLSKIHLARVINKIVPESERATFIVSQLESDSEEWGTKVIDMAPILIEDPSALESTCRWMMKNLFKPNVNVKMRREGVALLLNGAFDTELDLPLREQIRKQLREVSLARPAGISPFYWFERWDWETENDWVADLTYDVCKQTLKDESASPLELSAAVAVLRRQHESQLGAAWKSSRDKELSEAVIDRIRSTNRSEWSNRYPELGSEHFTEHDILHINSFGHNEDFVERIHFDTGGICRHNDPIVELLRLAQSLSLADQIKPELQRLVTETTKGYENVRQLFQSKSLRAISVDWSSMTAKQIRWLRDPVAQDQIATEKLPTSQDWFDTYVYVFATMLLR